MRVVRNDFVVLGLHQQHVAEELGARAERAILLGAQRQPAVGGEIRVDVQLALRRLPVVVLVERRRAQREHADRPQVQQQRAEVRAVARADHRDRLPVYAGRARKHIVSRDDVVHVVLARHRVVQRLGIGVAAQVEGEAHAAQRGERARLLDVVVLVAAPAVHEQHPGRAAVRGLRREHRAFDALSVHGDGDRLRTDAH